MSLIPTLSIDFAAVTDVGCVRTNNEDSYGFDSNQHLYVVCDGMGGCAAGEIASSLAVRTLIDGFASSAPDGALEVEPVAIEQRLLQAIVDANQAVYQAASGDPALQSMGTTLVCACVDGDRTVIGNVGDSRAYLIRANKAIQITLDHSFVEEQIRAGNLSTDSAANSNLQSVITRAVGVAETVEPDLFEARLQPEDILLLASDGLTRYVDPEDIVLAIADGVNLPVRCRALIELAKNSGGADNITCLLVRLSTHAGSP
ncbi:MAG TPA: Stp1/IreP family PP2C-type Ser/Thr phosphatase [Terracidiphilus sp.]|nr:Stp1/IreP family PP2C-type Ser/Thr phosphatase [Terracidiphilus sp.]